MTVRKLFLGLPVLINGTPLHPLRNRSDRAARSRSFCSRSSAMSQSAYDRQILVGVNRQGGCGRWKSIPTAMLLESVYADPDAVTFMWLRDVATIRKSASIRVLWTD